MNFYYTDHNGEVVGPITREQLEQFVDAGVLPSTTQVCYEGSEQWQPVSAFARPTKKPQQRQTASSRPMVSSNLVVCPACQKEVSKNADVCPGCGQPIRRGFLGRSGTERVLNVGCFIIILVIVAFAILGSCSHR